MREFQFLRMLMNTCYCLSFEVVSHCGNDVEHLFMNLGPIVYRFGEMSIQSFAQFLKLIICLIVELKE